MNVSIPVRIYLVHVVFMCLLAAFSGCATQSGTSRGAKVQNVDVSSDVQRTFDQALQLLQEEQYDTAITLLISVIEQEKRLTAPYINLAMAYRHIGNEELAEENLLKALAIDQAQPVANNELGILYRKQGRFTDAKKVYINALSEYPDYLPVIKNLGIQCDIYMQDPQCALEQFEKYQQYDPEDKNVKVWIADLKTRI